MRAYPKRRLFGAVGSLFLLLTSMLATAGIAQASPPNWSMHVIPLPATVANGSNAGFDVTISNTGPSNISSLFLVSQTTATPVYLVSTTRPGACNEATLTGPLMCAFGALNAGESVNVVVAWATPSSGASYDPGLEGNTTGQTFKDPKRSHGDTLTDPAFTGITLRGDKNYGGGFNLSGIVADNNGLGHKNVQATSVVPPQANIPVTVADGPDVEFNFTGPGTQFGEWSDINVNSGHDYGATFFPVTLLVYGQSAPNDLSTIKVVHVGASTTDVLSQCTTTVHENCIQVSKVGNDVQIIVWLHQNGGVRGIG
jgi:hypothetical protein